MDNCSDSERKKIHLQHDDRIESWRIAYRDLRNPLCLAGVLEAVAEIELHEARVAHMHGFRDLSRFHDFFRLIFIIVTDFSLLIVCQVGGMSLQGWECVDDGLGGFQGCQRMCQVAIVVIHTVSLLLFQTDTFVMYHLWT